MGSGVGEVKVISYRKTKAGQQMAIVDPQKSGREGTRTPDPTDVNRVL